MRKRKLLWQLYPSYFLITLVSLLTFVWYISDSFRQFYLDQTAIDLESRARLVRAQFFPHFKSGEWEKLDSTIKEVGQQSFTRLTFILPSGQVVGDSEEAPEKMDNHANRPEIQAALQGNTKTIVRFSTTLQTEMMYVAIPVYAEQAVLGVTRVAIPITSLGDTLRGIQLKVFLGWLLILLVAAAVSWFISRRISRPLEEIKKGAQLFASGNLDKRLEVPNSEELGGLVETLNHMAAQLDDRIKTISQQNHVQEAILSSMVESLLAVDQNHYLINLNNSASKLFNLNLEVVKGRHLSEVIRNSELQEFIRKVLLSHSPLEEELILHDETERILQIRGTPLLDANGNNSLGALLVISDITQVRRLEQVRQDFVANVSHELKTPITSIKGAAETLIDGAHSDPDSALRFLAMIVRHADRLNGIIEDLLTLSRIEQDPDQTTLDFENMDLESTIGSALQVCEAKAQAKNIRLRLNHPNPIYLSFNSHLLEQAVINLIDNAIKYSAPETSVEVETTTNEQYVIIHVRDQGAGIAKDQLPRLFERFYRVDKARSRHMGGTGLGLAIVKHIAQAHQGHVNVASALGLGSTFSIYLPLNLGSPEATA